MRLSVQNSIAAYFNALEILCERHGRLWMGVGKFYLQAEHYGKIYDLGWVSVDEYEAHVRDWAKFRKRPPHTAHIAAWRRFKRLPLCGLSRSRLNESAKEIEILPARASCYVSPLQYGAGVGSWGEDWNEDFPSLPPHVATAVAREFEMMDEVWCDGA